MASVISMKALLESGVHFGHRTNKWNPTMKPFIFTERNGIHILDLQQTVKAINQVYTLISQTVAEGGTLLFVGTKRQAQETIKEEATRAGMPYVTERWLPGTLTNWVTIYQRIQEMVRLEGLRDSGEISRMTKKEALLADREVTRLNMRLDGLRDLKKLPSLIFIVDVMREETAVLEANAKNIPVIALVDTNCNPKGVDYVIPSNDDAIRAIKLLVGKMADAVLEGKSMRKDDLIDRDEASTPASMAAAQVRVPRPQMLEEDTADEDLLGEATLAKLDKKEEEVPAEEAMLASEEAVAEEAPAKKPARKPRAAKVAEEAAPAAAPAAEPAAEADTPEEAPAAKAKPARKTKKAEAEDAAE